MAAFAQFGSDLDATTQRLLNRGSRLTELLKQPQYQPQKMEDQVAVIYAATKGFVTEIPTPRLQEWAKSFVDFLHAKHPEITKGIADSKQVADDNAKNLEAALTEFNKSF